MERLLLIMNLVTLAVSMAAIGMSVKTMIIINKIGDNLEKRVMYLEDEHDGRWHS